MIPEQCTGSTVLPPVDLKIPVTIKSHPQVESALLFGEEVTENKWLSELLFGKVVAEFGCSFGLRAAYLAPYVRRIFCTDPDATLRGLAKMTLSLNQCYNSEVVARIAEKMPADVLLIDTRRYNDSRLPEIRLDAPIVITTGPLRRSAASTILGAGYEHLPQYHRAAVFAAPRRHHGFQ